MKNIKNMHKDPFCLCFSFIITCLLFSSSLLAQQYGYAGSRVSVDYGVLDSLGTQPTVPNVLHQDLIRTPYTSAYRNYNYNTVAMAASNPTLAYNAAPINTPISAINGQRYILVPVAPDGSLMLNNTISSPPPPQYSYVAPQNNYASPPIILKRPQTSNYSAPKKVTRPAIVSVPQTASKQEIPNKIARVPVNTTKIETPSTTITKTEPSKQNAAISTTSTVAAPSQIPIQTPITNSTTVVPPIETTSASQPQSNSLAKEQLASTIQYPSTNQSSTIRATTSKNADYQTTNLDLEQPKEPEAISPTNPTSLQSVANITRPKTDAQQPAATEAPAEEVKVISSLTTTKSVEGQYSIPFTEGSSQLSGNGPIDLDKTIEEMNNNPEMRVQLLSFASSKGEDNNSSKARRLALQRALETRKYMSEKGIIASRIEVRSLGAADGDKTVDKVEVIPLKS
ncbi:MAG: OmpA family protein [Alphaproteobacteria bacterium]|nr:OmpA family protein [Alphaproteobacteria bacterium]